MHRNEDFFQVFGHISVFYSTLDFLVTLTILKLVDKNKTNRSITITSKTTLQQKFRMIEKLKPEEVINHVVLDNLREILPKALELGEKRNRFMHDQWIFDPHKIAEGKISRLEIQGVDSEMIGLEGAEETNLIELYTFLSELGDMQKRVSSIYDILMVGL